MKFKSVLLLFLFFGSCIENKKKEFLSSFPLDTLNLTVETYKAYGGGVYGGDLDSYYLTDSVNFRKYIGLADDHEYYSFKITGNKIEVVNSKHNLLKSKTLKLDDLIAEKEFE